MFPFIVQPLIEAAPMTGRQPVTEEQYSPFEILYLSWEVQHFETCQDLPRFLHVFMSTLQQKLPYINAN